MKQEIKEIIELLPQLKQEHHYCEDTFYSCPKEPTEGCCDPNEGDECNCGADKHNERLDNIIKRFQDISDMTYYI